jgi:N-acetylneuraminic acid mutarotase
MDRKDMTVFLLIITAGLAAGDSWTVRAPMLTARHGVTSAPVCGAIFTIGGKGFGSDVAVNEAFDPGWNNWRRRTDMPVARNGVSSGVVNNKVYVFGGTSNGSINCEYDPSPDTWTTKAPMPTERCEIASVTLGSKIYAIGGKIAGVTTPIMEIYDPATDTWTAGPSMPTSRSGASAAAVDGKIHVLGGCTTTMFFLNTHEVYDTLTHAWTTTDAMPTPRAFMACAAVDGIIYLISGYNGSTHQTRNDAFDTHNNTWLTKDPIPTPRKGAGCAVNGSKIYVIGGSNEEYLATCEEYTPDIIGVEEGEDQAARDRNDFYARMTGRKISLDFKFPVSKSTRVTLLDISGRKVDEWERPMARNMTLRPNSGSDFPNGIYFLSVTTEGSRTVKKLVCCR